MKKEPLLARIFEQKLRTHEKKGVFSPVFLNQNSDLMKKKVSPRLCFEQKFLNFPTKSDCFPIK